MNSITTSVEASEESEFLSALNASFQSFVHKTLKDEQIECIHSIACHGKDVLAVLPTGLGKSAIYVLSPLSLVSEFVDTRLSKTKHPRFPKFPSIIHVIDRSDRNPPITAR